MSAYGDFGCGESRKGKGRGERGGAGGRGDGGAKGKSARALRMRAYGGERGFGGVVSKFGIVMYAIHSGT